MMFSVLKVLSVLSEEGFSPFSYGTFPHLLILDISIKIVLSHVVSFPTNLVSLNSESVCKNCGCFGKGCSGTTATRADVIFYYRSRAVLPLLLSGSTAPEKYYRGS